MNSTSIGILTSVLIRSLPRVSLSSTDLAEDDNYYNGRKRKNDRDHSVSSDSSHNSTNSSNVRIARYRARQASYEAKQAHFEAMRADYERGKMEYAIQLAQIELDRDTLAVKKMELELKLLKEKKATA